MPPMTYSFPPTTAAAAWARSDGIVLSRLQWPSEDNEEEEEEDEECTSRGASGSGGSKTCKSRRMPPLLYPALPPAT